MKLYHQQKGVLTPADKKYNPLGNKIEQLYSDEKGQKHSLDGTETPYEEIQAQENDLISKGQDNLKQQKLQELSDEMDFEKNLEEHDQKEADREEKGRMHTEVVKEVKNASEAIVEAVKGIPETVIPKIDIPDHYKEEQVWQKQVLEVLRKEINLPETNFEPVVKAIQALKFPEVRIPEPKDYTKLLEEIKKALLENTDLSKVEKLLSEIKPFEIPEKLLTKDGKRLKVEVDRIAIGGGGGGLNAAESTALQGVATEETLQAVAGFNIPKYDSVTASYNDGTFTETYVFKLGVTTVATVTVIYVDISKAKLVSATKV